MKLRDSLAVFVLISAACAQEKRPDVFLITIDTLRADHVHCYGYPNIQTPALDGLAKDGVLFAQAFSPSPITNSSHASILTGLLPSTHGVTDFGAALSADHATMAQLLQQRGYQTAAFIGAVVLDSKLLAPGFDNGFDFYDNFPKHVSRAIERRGMEVVRHAEAWLSTHAKGPRFVWLHLYDPHDPYQPPAPYSELYKDRLYDGEIAYADSALAQFLAFLRTHQMYANSLIIVTGDHGEGLGEHGEDTHGIFLYDSTTHVPLIVKLPGGKVAGKVVDGQVRTVDILPTVLGVVHAPGAEFNGESLRPYFENYQAPGRVALGETGYPLSFGWAALRSVRTPEWLFVDAPRPELYDLKTDPGELKNRYQPTGQEGVRMRSMLAPLPSWPLPDPKDKIEEQNLLHKAMLATDASHYTEAREALERVLRIDPKSYLALQQLGNLELDARQYAAAAEHFKEAHKLHGADAASAFSQAQALEKLHDLQGARDALESSLKIAPGQFQARLLLGQVYLGLGNASAAEDQLEAALLLEPKSADAKLWLARAHLAAKSK